MATISGSYALLPLEGSQEDEGLDPPTEELELLEDEQPLNKFGFWCLLVQHASK
jgi:hypothetical protein